MQRRAFRIGPWIHLLRITTGLVGLALLAGCSLLPPPTMPAASSVPPAGTRVPMTAPADLPIVHVECAGRSWTLVVDTGSSLSFVSPELAAAAESSPARNHSRTKRSFYARSAAGTPVRARLTRLPELHIGEAVFHDVPVGVSDFTALALGTGHDVDGLLGFGTLRQLRPTLDYPSRTLRLDPPAKPAADLPPTGSDAVTLPFRSQASLPFVRLPLGRRTIEFLLDSGSTGSLELPAARLRLPFVTPPRPGFYARTMSGEVREPVARLADSLHIGPTEFPRPTVTAMPNQPRLGLEVLHRFTVAFDPANRRVTFTPAQPGPQHLPSIRVSGLVLDRRADGWAVVHVLPECPASDGTVQPGDLCLKVEGEPVSAWPRERWGPFAAKATTILYTFRRGDRVFDANLPVLVLVP